MKGERVVVGVRDMVMVIRVIERWLGLGLLVRQNGDRSYRVARGT